MLYPCCIYYCIATAPPQRTTPLQARFHFSEIVAVTQKKRERHQANVVTRESAVKLVTLLAKSSVPYILHLAASFLTCATLTGLHFPSFVLWWAGLGTLPTASFLLPKF